MCEKYRLMVAEEAKKRLEQLEQIGATRHHLRREIAFELAYRSVAKKLAGSERLNVVELGLDHGFLRSGELQSDDCSLEALVLRVLRAFSEVRPRIAI